MAAGYPQNNRMIIDRLAGYNNRQSDYVYCDVFFIPIMWFITMIGMMNFKLLWSGVFICEFLVNIEKINS